MSETYDCKVLSLEGTGLELEVTTAQPDCCPLYTSKRFVLGLLLDASNDTSSVSVSRDPGSIPLWDAIPSHVTEDIGASRFDAAPFILSVEVTGCSTSSWDYGDPEPVAIYKVHVADSDWVKHLRVGQTWGSVSYDEEGTFLQLGKCPS